MLYYIQKLNHSNGSFSTVNILHLAHNITYLSSATYSAMQLAVPSRMWCFQIRSV